MTTPIPGEKTRVPPISAKSSKNKRGGVAGTCEGSTEILNKAFSDHRISELKTKQTNKSLMLHSVTRTGCVDTFRLSAATSQRGSHLFSTQQLQSCIDRQYLLTRGQFSATAEPVLLLTGQLVSLTCL